MRLRAVLVGVVAVLLCAQPAAAFSAVTTTGTVGHWEVLDNPVVDQEGARCFYVNGNGGSVIDRVRVRAPSVVNGSHANMTWVGWRFKILRSTDGGATFQTFYKSPIWKDKASSSQPADDFSSRFWYRHGNLGDTRILVQLTIFFYRPGSSSRIEGKVIGRYDNYSYKFKGTPAAGTISGCLTLEA